MLSAFSAAFLGGLSGRSLNAENAEERSSQRY